MIISGGSAWQGGAGHQMASFQLKNNGPVACLVRAKSQPLLVNGDGIILITGADAGAAATLRVEPNGILKSSVQTSNLCAAPPIVAPVLVEFVLPGTGLVIVPAPSTTDTGGVPSCLADPGTPTGSIDMQSWAP
jgi:hypothetical protein